MSTLLLVHPSTFLFTEYRPELFKRFVIFRGISMSYFMYITNENDEDARTIMVFYWNIVVSLFLAVNSDDR